MVFLEALSSGCFPVATYFAGAKNKIDTVAPHLGEDARFMKLRVDHVAQDIVPAVTGALAARDRYAQTLRRIAEEEYDWQPIATKLARTMEEVAASR